MDVAYDFLGLRRHCSVSFLRMPTAPHTGFLMTTINPETNDSFRLISVGTKLAATVLGLLLVISGLVYWQLSNHEREGLLRAKELAATAVVRLFADSCEAPVVFNDETAIRDALATLGRNPEVVYAGVWSIVDQKPSAQLGELKRGPVETATTVPSAVMITRHPNRVVVTAPVFEHGTKLVAMTIVSLSLDRENAAIAKVERSILWSSAGVALGLALLLIGVSRLMIVLPLGKLVAAAKHLEKGNVTELDISTRDELGLLSRAFRSMAQAIRSREEAITARNRDMRFVLDNVGQGFITLDIEGRLSQERSRVVDVWFGTPQPGARIWEYLEPTSHHFSVLFKTGWEALRDGFLPLELYLDQLPHTVELEAQSFEFSYRPILVGDELDKVIVVISDVTQQMERERAEQTQREMMMLFNRLLSDRVALDEYFSEGASLVSAIESDDPQKRAALKRNIHTLKGSSALFGLESIAEFCHEIEERLGEDSDIDPKDKTLLRALWTRAEGMRAALAHEDSIELDRNEYDSFLEDLTRRADHSVLMSRFSSWRHEPAERRLKLLREQTLRLAERLGKDYTEVEYLPTKLRLPQGRWSPFWSAFSHVIRNAVDHGVDTAEERANAHKPPHATITLSLEQNLSGLTLSIRDDGRGIDWARVEERAKARGLPYKTRKDLEEALFTEGVSTAGLATSVSGRGVGLGAVREATRGLGGKIQIESEPGHGTCFSFVFPSSVLSDDISMTGLAKSIPVKRVEVAIQPPLHVSNRPGEPKPSSLFPYPRRPHE